jgi:hypothetical protein
MVNLWHVKAQLNLVFDDTVTQPDGFTSQKIHTEVNPLSVEFDLDQNLFADETTFTASYGYSSSSQMQAFGQTTLSQTSVPVGTSYTGLGFVGARNINICDDETVVDPNASDIQGSFALQGSIDVPVTLTTTPSQNGPNQTTTGLGIQAIVGYDDYNTNTSHDGVLPPADPFPWTAVHTIFNDPGKAGSLSCSTNTTTCTITQKAMAINYFPQSQDVRVQAKNYTKQKAVNNTLLNMQPGFKLHANNLLQPTVEGQDVSNSGFCAWRWVRVWTAPLGSDGVSRTGQYVSAAVAPPTQNIPTVPTGWMYDNAPASGVRDTAWYDIPMGPSLPANPKKWPAMRQLDEFVASVWQYPEFGFVYYAVTFDSLPNACGLTMYPAQPISLNQWCAMKNSSAPYMSEGAVPGDPQSTQSLQPPDGGSSASPPMSTGWMDSGGNPTQPGGSQQPQCP